MTICFSEWFLQLCDLCNKDIITWQAAFSTSNLKQLATYIPKKFLKIFKFVSAKYFI
jgi:hypothetical protein